MIIKNHRFLWFQNTSTVTTGDVDCAGTDANVYINILGSKGETGRIKLAKSQTFLNKFERGHVDIFQLETMDIGDLHQVILEHDNRGIGRQGCKIKDRYFNLFG